MYYIAGRFTGNPADQEDLVQDATIRLMNNISTLKQLNRCKIAKYIVLTIRTAFLDHARKEYILFLDDNSLEERMIEHIGISDAEDQLFAKLAIAQLKKELPTRDWIILEGKHFIGLSEEELSQLAGVSQNSVRMVLHRARERAKKILQEINYVRG